MKLTGSILLAIAIAAPLSAQALRPATERGPVVVTAQADTQRVALHVEGMTCGGCAISTRVLLNRLDGVKASEVDYERKRAIVTYDPAVITPAQMIRALKEKLGYTARVIAGSAR